MGFTQDLISPSKITISQKGVSIYSSLLIFIIHHYCGMFYNPRRVIVSNINILRCTQQAHVKISQKFKIFSKSHYLRLWAGKCTTWVHIKKFSLSHPYIPNVFQNQFWLAGSIFRPSCDSSKFKSGPKNDLKKNFHIHFRNYAYFILLIFKRWLIQ